MILSALAVRPREPDPSQSAHSNTARASPVDDAKPLEVTEEKLEAHFQP